MISLEQFILNFLFLTSFDNLAEVSAPFWSKISTAAVSAAFTAKKRTGIGRDDAFGSAPLHNKRRTVASRWGRLKKKVQQSQVEYKQDCSLNKSTLVEDPFVVFRKQLENKGVPWLCTTCTCTWTVHSFVSCNCSSSHQIQCIICTVTMQSYQGFFCSINQYGVFLVMQ